jgi:hypothetical protein
MDRAARAGCWISGSRARPGDEARTPPGPRAEPLTGYGRFSSSSFANSCR